MAIFGGAGLAVAGGLVSAFGKKKAAKAQKEAAKASAKVVKERTKVQSIVSERAAQKVIGGGKADIGASGIQIAGSAADVIRESERDAAFELETIQRQGKLEARALRKGGQVAGTAGSIGAAGSIIGGLTQAAGLGLFG